MAAQAPGREETPPRAWGRPRLLSRLRTNFRNTPTGVGKTLFCSHSVYSFWKHPHGRGEDCSFSTGNPQSRETPPRAWGRLSHRPDGVRIIWKHPHGRGEDPVCFFTRCLLLETPPRAWGRPQVKQTSDNKKRNTPTGVGKTLSYLRHVCLVGKHPHGRGEDSDMGTISTPILETPPRAWGRRQRMQTRSFCIRNTPTGVGKTSRRWNRTKLSEKHPHGRGEDYDT